MINILITNAIVFTSSVLVSEMTAEPLLKDIHEHSPCTIICITCLVQDWSVKAMGFLLKQKQVMLDRE